MEEDQDLANVKKGEISSMEMDHFETISLPPQSVLAQKSPGDPQISKHNVVQRALIQRLEVLSDESMGESSQSDELGEWKMNRIVCWKK